MAFPNTVTLTESACDAPGRWGPFFVGSVRWEITTIFDVAGGTGVLYAQSSADGGVTWAEIATGPTIAAGSYTCCQSQTDPTTIFVFCVNPDTSTPAMTAFNTATGWVAWMVDSPLFTLIANAVNQFMVVAHRGLDDVVIAAMPTGGYTDASGEDHALTTVCIFDVGSLAWGSSFDAGYSDYGSVIGWHQVPCGLVVGSDNIARLFMQQITHAVPLGAISFSGGETVPWYCTTADVEVWGGGGGGAASTDTAAGGGGGAGAYSSGSAGISGTLAMPTIGAGGAGGIFPGGGADPMGDGADGDSTSWLGLTATGGAGAVCDGTGAGAGNGGDGFLVTSDAGGGGGGGSSDGPSGSGNAGDPGIIYDGTPGDPNGGAGGVASPGLAQSAGGAGGTYDPVALTGNGGDGQQVGGGGGGGAKIGDGGHGGNGQVAARSQPAQATVYNSRLWQQAILTDNSLGTLDEIADGAFEMQFYEQNVTLMPFDCAAGSGYVAIAFSGAIATTGYEDVEAGSGANADPISFSLQTFASGTGGGSDPSPAVAVLGATVFVSYHDGTNFGYRADAGGGFGGFQSFGTFSDAYSRIQAGAAPTDEITFGTPTTATVGFSPPT